MTVSGSNRSSSNRSSASNHSHSTRSAQSTRSARAARPAAGANPKLAAAVKSIHISQYHARGKTTYCNQAFKAYASKLGYKGFGNMVANQMYKKMAAPGSGWKQVSAKDAMAAAKNGKLVAAAWYNNKPRAGRPDGKAPGHIAAVIGEYSPGVPAIAQAGIKTFEYGPITATRKNPTYFVKE